MKKSEGMVLRKVNIKGWDSPVAQKYALESIPYFIVYTPEGRLYKKGFAVYKEVLQGFGKVLTIVKKGERVDLTKHLVKGKYTLFEFYADW